MPKLYRRAAGAAVLIIAAHFGPGQASAATPRGVVVLGAPSVSAPAEAPGKALRPRAPVPAVDVDAAGREPFQATLDLNISGNLVSSVTIPAGKRLIVDNINIAGDAASNTGPIQPIILAYVGQAGWPQVNFYYGVAGSAVGGQFYSNFPVTLYADTLQFGLGFSGYSPAYLGMIINVSGHLISVTTP